VAPVGGVRRGLMLARNKREIIHCERKSTEEECRSRDCGVMGGDVKSMG